MSSQNNNLDKIELLSLAGNIYWFRHEPADNRQLSVITVQTDLLLSSVRRPCQSLRHLANSKFTIVIGNDSKLSRDTGLMYVARVSQPKKKLLRIKWKGQAPKEECCFVSDTFSSSFGFSLLTGIRRFLWQSTVCHVKFTLTRVRSAVIPLISSL